MSEGPRVLFIDDDAALRRLAQRALTRRGYRVETAASGLEGLGMVAESGFDLVAVDHFMPGLDGLGTLERLCELPDTPPVVYVTGAEESRIAVAALKAGAVDYIVKSVGDDFFDLLDSTFRQALAAVALRRDKERAEAELQASNEQLQAMLREVNHRVANSLQLVSSFVRLQANALSDPGARHALEDTQQRIIAIGQVHKRLYSSADVDTVDMHDYLAALAGELELTWSTATSPRRVLLQAQPLRLKTDKAVSVGIIVTELVSNACKYAYAEGQTGDVRICLAEDGESGFRLSVSDDGQGMRPGESPKGTGLGAALIAAMAKGLRSTVEIDAGAAGVTATLVAQR
jgi:two-component sensor histidine kinase